MEINDIRKKLQNAEKSKINSINLKIDSVEKNAGLSDAFMALLTSKGKVYCVLKVLAGKKNVVQISSNDIAQILGLSGSCVRHIISDLQKENVLEVVEGTRPNIYVLTPDIFPFLEESDD